MSRLVPMLSLRPLLAALILSVVPAALAQAPAQPQLQPQVQSPDQVQPAPIGPSPTDISSQARRAQEAAAGGRATEALDALDEAAALISERMPLSIRRATFVAEEPQGYGVFNPRDSTIFEGGQPLLVYAELAGQGWRRSGDIFRTDISLDFELRTKDGQALVAQKAFNTIATASRRRNREFFLYLTYSFTGVEPGDYVVRTIVNDRAGNKQTSFDIAFTVRK